MGTEQINSLSFLKSLTPIQRVAVTYHGGPLLILAGPGSGKTEVISCRAAYLIRSGMVKPENLLATTFTERAALKLKDRIQKKLPEINVEAMQVSTIHSFCYKLLNDFRAVSPFPQGFHVLDEAGQLLFIYSRRKELGLGEIMKGREFDFFDEVMRTYNLATEELVEPKNFETWCEKRLKSAGNDEKDLWEERLLIARSYHHYRELLIEANATDFSNLQRHTLEMLSHRKKVLSEVQKRFSEVLIDEYQDTNSVQEEILFRVSAPEMYLAVVGDDDQSIYRFRGATVKNILNFDKKYCGVKVVKLEDNFRSLRPIIRHASQLIHCNPESARRDKEMRCVRTHWTNEVVVVHERTAAEEAKAVVSILRQLIADGTIRRLNDVAVLLRSVRSYAEPYLETLREAKLPFCLIGDGRFFERQDIEQLYGLFTFLGATKPWGDKFVRCRVMGLSAEAGKALEGLKVDIAEVADDAALKALGMSDSKERAKILGLVDLKRRVQEGKHRSLLEVLYAILRTSWYFGRVESEGDKEAVRNLGILTKCVSNFDAFSGTKNIYAFLSYLKLLRKGAQDSYCSEPEDALSVMTVHQAKGLEFPVVVIGAAMEGRFPTQQRHCMYEIPCSLMRSGEPEVRDPHLIDERKLFYVGSTRARDLLIIGAADVVNKRGGGPSRFIKEFLGDKLDEAVKRGRELKAHVLRVEEVGEKSYEPRLRLSYYHLAYFLQCPLRYRYFVMDGMENPLAGQLYFGSAVHRALELIHIDVMAKKKVTEKDVAQYISRAWIPVYRRKKDPEAEQEERKSKESAIRHVSRYVREHGLVFNRVEAAEQPFAVEIDDVIVAGKIDLIRDIDGRMKEIVDFKTSPSEAVSREQAMLQMDIYAVGLENTAGVRVGLQTLHFLEDGITRSEEWSVQKKAEVENMIARIVASIKKAEFRPRVEYCPYCAEFKTICPYFVGARERARTDAGRTALERKAFRQIKGVRSRRKGQKKD